MELVGDVAEIEMGESTEQARAKLDVPPLSLSLLFSLSPSLALSLPLSLSFPAHNTLDPTAFERRGNNLKRDMSEIEMGESTEQARAKLDVPPLLLFFLISLQPRVE